MKVFSRKQRKRYTHETSDTHASEVLDPDEDFKNKIYVLRGWTAFAHWVVLSNHPRVTS